MNAKDVIRSSMDMSERILMAYLGDLDDADLKIPPSEGMNPIAWQLGHLISSERSMIEGIKPGSSPALPEGFETAHSTEKAKAGALDPSAFRSKAEYISLWNGQRAATKTVLDGLSSADLDAPAPERMRNFVPTIGALISMTGSHALMHAGQFVPVRRKRGKPVVI
jgi:uncharacterized damage-inducible protein DinB